MHSAVMRYMSGRKGITRACEPGFITDERLFAVVPQRISRILSGPILLQLCPLWFREFVLLGAVFLQPSQHSETTFGSEWVGRRENLSRHQEGELSEVLGSSGERGRGLFGHSIPTTSHD